MLVNSFPQFSMHQVSKMDVLVMKICKFFVLFLFSLCAGLPRPSEDDLWKQVPGLIDCVPSPMPYKIADPKQCDKYYLCNNGSRIPQLCPDGTVFQFTIQNCVLLAGADCSSRPQLQESVATKQCPRKTGLFPHSDRRKCHQYFQCLDGRPILITCPDMLLFDASRGVCDYEDVIDTSRCDLPPSSVSCPVINETSDSSSVDPDGLYNRFLPHPTDCRKFYFCQTSRKPRPLACEFDQGFDLKTRSCINRRLVPRCWRSASTFEKQSVF